MIEGDPPLAEAIQNRSPRLFALGGWILICYVVAALSSIPTQGAIDTWYDSLQKPTLTPPNWTFGPVWTLLYTLMAIAVWLVWEAPPSYMRTRSIFRFYVQLAFNLLWSYLFFGMHLLGKSMVEIAVLLLLIGITAWHFFQVRAVAGLLMLPYFAWVAFAAYLNWGIWRMQQFYPQ